MALQMNLEPLELLEWGDGEFPLLDNSHSSEMANDPLYFDALTSLAVSLKPPHPQAMHCTGFAGTPVCACVQNLKAERVFPRVHGFHIAIPARHFIHGIVTDTPLSWYNSLSHESCVRLSSEFSRNHTRIFQPC